jgi:hypothetical protein
MSKEEIEFNKKFTSLCCILELDNSTLTLGNWSDSEYEFFFNKKEVEILIQKLQKLWSEMKE